MYARNLTPVCKMCTRSILTLVCKKDWFSCSHFVRNRWFMEIVHRRHELSFQETILLTVSVLYKFKEDVMSVFFFVLSSLKEKLFDVCVINRSYDFDLSYLSVFIIS